MRRLMLLCLAASSACNQIYGVETTELVDAAPDADLRPDRDGDGIADVEDSCIASERDGLEDTDGDGKANNVDDCPFISGSTGDTDVDGIGNDCDPFETVAGETITCTMRFLDRVLNASLWKPREGEAELAVASGYLFGFGQQAPKPLTSVIADERIAPTTGTIFLEMPIGTIIPQGFGFRVWASAGPVPSAADVACDFYANPTEVTATPYGGVTVIGTDPGPGFAGETALLARVVIQPGKTGANLACGLIYGTNSAVGVGHFDGGLGAQGVAVISGGVAVNGIVVMHRNDQPNLF